MSMRSTVKASVASAACRWGGTPPSKSRKAGRTGSAATGAINHTTPRRAAVPEQTLPTTRTGQTSTTTAMAEMTFPERTPEYEAARKPLYSQWLKQREPHWRQFMAGEITHSEYSERIAGFWKQYSDALEPHWVKAGGTPRMYK